MLSEPDNQETTEPQLDRIERALENMARELRMHRIPLSPLLTTGEVAHTLGVSVRTVRRYIEDGRLPTVVLDSGRGGRPSQRVQAIDLQTFIDARKENATPIKLGRESMKHSVERHLQVPDINY